MSIEYYIKRMKEHQKNAQEYELKAEQEMKDGSGAQAIEYCRLADMEKINARNFQQAMEAL
jgi:outer membrane lipoprotein-sorting protein